MSAYDRWLEEPYQRRYEEQDRFESWFEDHEEEISEIAYEHMQDHGMAHHFEDFVSGKEYERLKDHLFNTDYQDCNLQRAVVTYVNKYMCL